MRQGRSPPRDPDGLRRLEAEGLLNRFVNIVHGNDLSDEQLGGFVARDVRFALTPESELISGRNHLILGRLRDLDAWLSIGADIECADSGEMLTGARAALSHQRSLDNLDARRSRQFGGMSPLVAHLRRFGLGDGRGGAHAGSGRPDRNRRARQACGPRIASR